MILLILAALIGVYALALLACPTPDEDKTTSDLWIPRRSGA